MNIEKNLALLALKAGFDSIDICLRDIIACLPLLIAMQKSQESSRFSAFYGIYNFYGSTSVA